MRGDTAILLCDFDLEGDTLYSVKWYKGRREFYRYTPKEEPAMKIFPIQGLNVDRKQSSDRKLTLKRLEPAMSGRYSCEVSADAPSFHTSLVSADMEVVEVPSDRPTITGVRSRYRVGDILHSNCSSSWSRPPAKLNWVVNEMQGAEVIDIAVSLNYNIRTTQGAKINKYAVLGEEMKKMRRQEWYSYRPKSARRTGCGAFHFKNAESNFAGHVPYC